MKLIIQIPCFNEEQTLPATLAALPKKLDGVDEIEVLIIDDGSEDSTVKVAAQHAVHHILSISPRRGLAHAFRSGLERCLDLGADIIVNTDADNQYCAEDIALLIRPIVEKRADVVVGCRNIMEIDHFSPVKKALQHLGSAVVRWLSKTTISDTTSGFRAYSREAALRLNVFSTFTYTLETIIQAGQKAIATMEVPIRTNPKLRESRLSKSMFSYVSRSMATIVRIYLMYEPLKTFLWVSLVLFAVGAMPIARFLYAHFVQHYGGHIQSVVVGTTLMILAGVVAMLGLIGDVIAKNRMLNEEILYLMKKEKYRKGR